MPKPTTKKPRLVEIKDKVEQFYISEGMKGAMQCPINFQWDGKWWAESESLRKWRERRK